MALLLICLALLQDPEVYVEKATGLRFARDVGGMSRGEITDYANDQRPDLGVSVPYKLRDDEGKLLMSLDIYAYDLREKSITDGVDGEAVKKHFDQVKNDVVQKQGSKGWHSVKHIADSRAGLGAGKEAPLALKAEFEVTLKEGGPTMGSLIYLLGYKSRFLKIRLTYMADQKKKCEEAFEKLLSDLGRQIKPTPADPKKPKD
jgi:hypothetical protein